jgi:hypothetical protein
MEGTVVEVSESVLIQCYIALSLNGSYLRPVPSRGMHVFSTRSLVSSRTGSCMEVNSLIAPVPNRQQLQNRAVGPSRRRPRIRS